MNGRLLSAILANLRAKYTCTYSPYTLITWKFDGSGFFYRPLFEVDRIDLGFFPISGN